MLLDSPIVTGSIVVSGSTIFGSSLDTQHQFTGSLTVTGSLSLNGSNVVLSNQTSSISVLSASYAANSDLLDGRDSLTFANTGSNSFVGQQNINGSVAITGSLTTTGVITAQSINVQQVTSSIVYSSGSNVFGNSLSNTQSMTGSLQVSGSTHYLFGTIGIGMTNPFFGLDIASSSTSQTVLRITKTGGAEVFLQSFDDAAYFGTINSFPISINTGGSERMRITSGGNVAIGTTSNPQRLTILDANDAEGLGVYRAFSAASDAGTFIRLGALNGSSVPTAGAAIFGALESGKTSGYLSLLTYSSSTANERMRITSDGNVGIGTATPKLNANSGTFLTVQGTNASGWLELATTSTTDGNGGLISFNNTNIVGSDKRVASIYALRDGANNSAYIGFSTNNAGSTAERMRITSGGNVGIGTTNPAILGTSFTNQFTVSTTSGFANIAAAGATGSGGGLDLGTQTIRQAGIFSLDGSHLALYTNGTNSGNGLTERMRITSGGFTKISNTGTYVNSAGTYHELYSSLSNNNVAYFTNGASSNPYGPVIYFSAAAPNDATRYFLYCQDNTAERAVIRSNGGLANYSANDVNLSDERVKKDIIPLESYWDKFKAIEIVKFKYKDQIHDDFNIGVIAQQVEAVAPEFVDIDGWGNKPKLDEEGNEIINDEEPLKSIYTADLYHATIKVLQECMSKIEELKAEIDILKNN